MPLRLTQNFKYKFSCTNRPFLSVVFLFYLLFSRFLARKQNTLSSTELHHVPERQVQLPQRLTDLNGLKNSLKTFDVFLHAFLLKCSTENELSSKPMSLECLALSPEKYLASKEEIFWKKNTNVTKIQTSVRGSFLFLMNQLFISKYQCKFRGLCTINCLVPMI